MMDSSLQPRRSTSTLCTFFRKITLFQMFQTVVLSEGKMFLPCPFFQVFDFILNCFFSHRLMCLLCSLVVSLPSRHSFERFVTLWLLTVSGKSNSVPRELHGFSWVRGVSMWTEEPESSNGKMSRIDNS
jgi:hypothetical protein